MAKTNFKDEELRSVIAEMAEQLEGAWQTSKQELLAKAVPEESDDKAPVDPSSSDSSAPASDPATAGPGPDAGDASAAPASDASAPASADPAADAAPLTPEALQAEYSQLAPEELDMHIKAALAAKEALAASASAVAPDAASAGAPPMAMKAEIGGHETSESAVSEDTVDKGEWSESSSSSVGKAEIGGHETSESAVSEDTVDKGEMSESSSSSSSVGKAELISSHKKASGGQMVKKSEKAVDPRDAKIAELESLVKTQAGDIQNLTSAVKMVLERPERKAITTIAALSKHEAPDQGKKEFTAAEAREYITSLAPRLNKAERELMFDFYGGKVKADKLAPIFEKYNASPKK